MDGHTEPLIAVIGNPIAGNPSQLAIELALQSLGIEFRVTSFQVAPEDCQVAIDGLQVLNYRGVLVDSSLSMPAGAWKDEVPPDEYAGAHLDCLYRDAEQPQVFQAADAHGQWLSRSIKSHLEQHGQSVDDYLWLGNRNKKFPADLLVQDQISLSTRAPTIESVAAANIIVLSPGPKGDVPLDIQEWPDDDGSTLIVDLTDGNEEICNAADKGYSVISSLDRQIGTIARCFRLWTDVDPSTTIIQEAIEEYLSV
jgi:hypothetical protein